MIRSLQGGRIPKILLALISFALADIFLAQLAKFYWPFWDPARTEARYRIPSPIYHHDLAASVDVNGVWGKLLYRVRTNSLGFKDRAVQEIPLRSDRHRILIMGDSFTEGVGLNYARTFVGLIDEALQQQQIHVLNAAVASYSPSIYYRKTKYLIEEVRFEFDELVVFIDISDIQDEAEFYELDANDVVRMRQGVPGWTDVWHGTTISSEESGKPRWKRLLKNNSVTVHLASRIRNRLQGFYYVPEGQAGLPPKTQVKRALWTLEPAHMDLYGARGLQKCSTRMDRLLALLRAHSIPLTVAVYPWPDQVARDDRDSLQVSFWRDWCDERGVQFVNLFPAFFEPGVGAVGRYFIPNDVHLNEAGNKLVADRFLAAFRSADDASALGGAERRLGVRAGR